MGTPSVTRWLVVGRLIGRLHLSHALHSASTARISRGLVAQRRASLWPLLICVPPHAGSRKNGTPATVACGKLGETGVPLELSGQFVQRLNRAQNKYRTPTCAIERKGKHSACFELGAIRGMIVRRIFAPCRLA